MISTNHPSQRARMTSPATDGREIPRFVGALVTGADFAKGSRFTSGGGSDDITFSGILVASSRADFSIVSSARATRTCATAITPSGRSTCPSSTELRRLRDRDRDERPRPKAGLAIQEIPSYEHLRPHGIRNLKVMRDGARIARFIVLERFAGAHSRIAP
jgi:hypothetical protein